MKTFNQNQLVCLLNLSVYFVYYKGKLIETHPLRTKYTKVGEDENGIALYDIKTVFVIQPTDEYFSVSGFDQIYESKKDFEENKPISRFQSISFDLSSGTGIKLCFALLGYNFSTMKYWVADDKKETAPFVEKTLPMDIFFYDYKTDKWSNDCVPETDYYPTRETALSWNTYDVALKDGTIKQVLGRNKLLKLDEDQRELVGQFLGIMKKLKENKIVIQTDICNDIYAYNARNVEDIDTTYDNRTEDGYEKCDGWDKKFWIGTIDEYGDDNDVWIKRKEAE